MGTLNHGANPIWPNQTRDLQPTAIAVIALAIVLATTHPAMAAGSGMPWEAPLQRILDSVQGPVAKVSAVVIIVITGLSLSFGDMSGGFRRMIQIVFGLSIAFAGGAMIDGELP